jgi:hypothetical protein
MSDVGCRRERRDDEYEYEYETFKRTDRESGKRKEREGVKVGQSSKSGKSRKERRTHMVQLGKIQPERIQSARS